MKSAIYILAIVCFISTNVKAQKKTKEERQREETEEYIDKIFGENDKDFAITAAPEKWADEPVVILCQKQYFNYRMYSKRGAYYLSYEKKGVLRKRLLIQDKSALDDYSEYYYQYGGEMGISIIKPDGSTNEIDFSSAVKVEQDVPTRYRNKYRSVGYYKIAIPNLEVGDIIDYYVIYRDDVSNYVGDIATLSEEYPIVTQEYIFDIPKMWNFQHRSFNGAPEIELSADSGISIKGEDKNSVKRYILKDADREAMDRDRWDMPYLTEPTIKVLSVFKNYFEKREGENNSINEKKLFTQYHTLFMADAKQYANKTLSTFNSNAIKKMPPEVRVEYLYKMLKYTFLNNVISSDNMDLVKYGDVQPYARDYNVMRNAFFIFAFNKLLARYKIERDYVMLMPKQYGFIEDAITPDEFVFGIYIPITDTYYFEPNNYSIAGESREFLYGATGYRWDASKISFWKKNYDMEKIELPESKFDQHVVDATMTVTLGESQNIELEKQIDYTGLYKRSMKPFLLFNTQFAFDEVYQISKKDARKKLDAFNGTNEVKASNWRLKKSQKLRASQEDKIEEYEEEKVERVQNWVKQQYDIEEINTFEVLDSGMKLDNALSVKYSFETEEYLMKAGPNLIFDVGGLIADQVELSEREINERKKPVELSHARTIKNTLTITIPEGKAVEGLEALNMNVDNESAAFVSTATQTGSTVTVTTKKIYKQEYLPLEKWPELVEMLEAAYKFSQLKVVVK